MVQPQTDACTPSPVLDPHTPLPLPQPPRATPPVASLTPGAEVGLDEEEAERSLEARGTAASPGVKPKPRGDGRGVVERLFRDEWGACTGCCTGREPMGPTEPMGPVMGWDGGCDRADEGESAPTGDEVEVTGGSAPKTGLTPELGDEVLLAREGDWRDAPGATGAIPPSGPPATGGWAVTPNRSILRGEGPRTPAADDGVPPAGESGPAASSAKVPGGKKAGLSLPYRALC